MKDFMMRQGKYEWPEYDESDAQDMHKSLLESGKLIDYVIWSCVPGRPGPPGRRGTASQCRAGAASASHVPGITLTLTSTGSLMP